MRKYHNLVVLLKEAAKSHPLLYRLVFAIFSPVFTYLDRQPTRLFKKYGRPTKGDVIFNLGSGAQDFRCKEARVFNLDLARYKPVSVIGDVCELPIRSESLFAVISYVVLEHVKEPEWAVREMERVVKPGGFIYICVPFLQPFHSCPDDHRRWTHEGARAIYKRESLVLLEEGVLGGPTSALLWTFQMWLSTLLSFGIRPLRDIIYIAVSILTFPIKWLDVLFWLNPLARECASVSYVLFQKKPT
ncbi:MAG: class I SAM-dependent methyltransferase [candidate division WOR-3 bacterium]